MSKEKKFFNEFLLPVIVLVTICAIVAALMATVNLITRPRIEAGNKQKEAEALSIVLPENQGFEQLEFSELPESVVGVYKDNGSDFLAVMLSIKGYDSSKPMSVAVGFDGEGKITKCSVISCNGETKGIGTKVSNEDFLSKFNGKTNSSSVDAISGATVSSTAFKSAIDDACRIVAEYRATEAAK